MKKIFTIIAAVALFISCDESKETIDTLSYPADAFVSLAESSATVPESSADAIDIVLNLSTSKEAATSPTNVGFTISSENATEGVHYTIVGGKTSFDVAANTFQDVLQIVPIDNTDEDGNKVITITLNDSPVGLGFPGPDGLGKTFTLILEDDDCALVADLFKGTPTGNETSGGSAGEAPSEVQFTLTSSTATTATYKLSGILAPQFTTWGEKITTGGEYSVTFDNTDPMNPKIVAIDNGDPLSNGLTFFYAQTDDEWGYYLKLDSASFSTCGKSVKMKFTIDITQASTGSTFPTDFNTELDLQF